MKHFILFQIMMAGVAALCFSSCDLFTDEDKCQVETTESRIWLPDRDIAYSPIDSSVSFVFSREGVLYKRSFQIDNVCPLGALGVKINIKEKGSLFAPQPLRYRMLIVERFPDNNFYQVRKLVNIYRQSSNELKGEGIVELAGLPEEGPRFFFVGVAAVFTPGTFNTLFELEDWAKENVSQVEFTASFVRYE
jgi:hypothetical protein